MLRCFLFLFLMVLGVVRGAPEEATAKIVLKGFLGEDETEAAKKIIEDVKDHPKTLIIEINSTSGDLISLLDLAKTIYVLKSHQPLKVIVYIDDNAVGPSAILPFLADEVYTSLIASWGDIPAGAEREVPANLLRNRIKSLISPANPHAKLLFIFADAMTDPSLQVVENEGWKLIERGKEHSFPLLSSPDQTLVVNQNQLRELGIVKEVYSLAEFEKLFSLTPAESEALENIPSSTVEAKLQKYIPFNQEGPNSIGYLYVGDHETAISESTWLYIKQGLDYYKTNRPQFIILEIDTPGGEVFAAQKISDALKEMDTQHNIPIITFINNWAISAGAMLAYSTRFITVVKDGSIGAAEPVIAGESGKMETASEKVNSALRADFANRARFFDRNPLIAEAMVDKDLILIWRHGKVMKLDNENQIRSTGREPDKIITPKGKLLTLDADQMIEYGVADYLLLPKKLPSITQEEKKAGKWAADKMLLFHAPYFSEFPQAEIHAYKMDWKTEFFVFLATPWVSSLLLMGFFIGAYLEFNNPGFSLPGAVAATSLFLIVLSSFSLEIANWLELILILTGLAVILVEFFILPTFGLLGIVGAVLFIAGLIGALVPGLSSISFEPDTQSLNAAGEYVLKRLAWFCGTLFASAFAISLLARYVLPRFSGFNRFVLSGHEQMGYIAGENPSDLPQPGMVGKTLTPLRPAGKIIVNGQVYEALSTGGFIDEGMPVIIDRLEGSTVFATLLKENDIL
ncbi:MAG: serine protease [Candidatus Protochlamydia sp.]|nr:serine protease [Candidatus Protochlamydia sp.]